MRPRERWKLAVACAMALAVIMVFAGFWQYQMLKDVPAVAVCK